MVLTSRQVVSSLVQLTFNPCLTKTLSMISSHVSNLPFLTATPGVFDSPEMNPAASAALYTGSNGNESNLPYIYSTPNLFSAN